MNDKIISKNRKKKEGIVADLSQKVEKATSIIFTNYQGLTHQQLERIKKTAKKLEAEYITTKNTLRFLTKILLVTCQRFDDVDCSFATNRPNLGISLQYNFTFNFILRKYECVNIFMK